MNLETKKIVSKVEGWITDKEGELLYHLAKNCKGNGKIVEIGSWKGKSSILLAHGSKSGNNVSIYAIDPHTGSPEHKETHGEVWTFEEFKKNIKNAKVEDIINPIVKTSEEAAKNFNEPIEFIFIDGNHDYEQVKSDFKLWFPKVIDGGIIAFHDTNTNEFPGPKKLVKDEVFKSKYFKNARFVDSITFAQKVKQNSVEDRLKNRYHLLLKNSHEFIAKMQLPKPVKTIGKKLFKLLK